MVYQKRPKDGLMITWGLRADLMRAVQIKEDPQWPKNVPLAAPFRTENVPSEKRRDWGVLISACLRFCSYLKRAASVPTVYHKRTSNFH